MKSKIKVLKQNKKYLFTLEKLKLKFSAFTTTQTWNSSELSH